MTWLAFIRECDNMFCLLCAYCLSLCHVVWSLYVGCTFAYLFVLFIHVFLLVCPCHQALLQDMIWCEFTPIFINEISRPTFVHGNQIQTYICPLWIHTLFVCLFVHRLSLFACLFTCFPPLLVCFYMLTSFARLLCICLSTLSSCLVIACDGWSTHATYKRKEKGHILADLGA